MSDECSTAAAFFNCFHFGFHGSNPWPAACLAWAPLAPRVVPPDPPMMLFLPYYLTFVIFGVGFIVFGVLQLRNTVREIRTRRWSHSALAMGTDPGGKRRSSAGVKRRSQMARIAAETESDHDAAAAEAAAWATLGADDADADAPAAYATSQTAARNADDQAARAATAEPHAHAAPAVPPARAFHQAVSEAGFLYYYDAITQESVWDLPQGAIVVPRPKRKGTGLIFLNAPLSIQANVAPVVKSFFDERAFPAPSDARADEPVSTSSVALVVAPVTSASASAPSAPPPADDSTRRSPLELTQAPPTWAEHMALLGNVVAIWKALPDATVSPFARFAHVVLPLIGVFWIITGIILSTLVAFVNDPTTPSSTATCLAFLVSVCLDLSVAVSLTSFQHMMVGLLTAALRASSQHANGGGGRDASLFDSLSAPLRYTIIGTTVIMFTCVVVANVVEFSLNRLWPDIVVQLSFAIIVLFDTVVVIYSIIRLYPLIPEEETSLQSQLRTQGVDWGGLPWHQRLLALPDRINPRQRLTLLCVGFVMLGVAGLTNVMMTVTDDALSTSLVLPISTANYPGHGHFAIYLTQLLALLIAWRAWRPLQY